MEKMVDDQTISAINGYSSESQTRGGYITTAEPTIDLDDEIRHLCPVLVAGTSPGATSTKSGKERHCVRSISSSAFRSIACGWFDEGLRYL
jgi:hypothetical protein